MRGTDFPRFTRDKLTSGSCRAQGAFILWFPALDNCKNLSDSFQYKSKSLKTKPSSKVKKKSPPGPHPIQIAKKFQNQIEAGTVNKAELARRHGMSGMSRARVTQIMNLLKLAPEIREEILNFPDKKKSFFTERKLRKIVRLSQARKQILAFEHLKLGIKLKWNNVP